MRLFGPDPEAVVVTSEEFVLRGPVALQRFLDGTSPVRRPRSRRSFGQTAGISHISAALLQTSVRSRQA